MDSETRSSKRILMDSDEEDEQLVEQPAEGVIKKDGAALGDLFDENDYEDIDEKENAEDPQEDEDDDAGLFGDDDEEDESASKSRSKGSDEEEEDSDENGYYGRQEQEIEIEQHVFLAVSHPTQEVLQTSAILKKSMTFVPTSTTSETHKQLREELYKQAQSNNIYVGNWATTDDPEKIKREAVKAEEINLKARRKLEQKRRNLESRHESGSSSRSFRYDSHADNYNNGGGFRDQYEEDDFVVQDEDDEEEENRAKRLKDLKRKGAESYKKRNKYEDEEEEEEEEVDDEEEEEEAAFTDEEERSRRHSSKKRRIVGDDSDEE